MNAVVDGHKNPLVTLVLATVTANGPVKVPTVVNDCAAVPLNVNAPELATRIPELETLPKMVNAFPFKSVVVLAPDVKLLIAAVDVPIFTPPDAVLFTVIVPRL